MIVFTGPRLKVQRAKEHISDLNRGVLAFKRKNPYKIVEDRDSKPGYHLLRVIELFKPPENWPVIIGDVLHNLHSGLDILACDICRTFGRKNVRNIYFPFAKSADTFEDAIKNRKINKTTPNIVNEFRGLKAYEGGDAILYGIHTLNLSDKHQLLITIKAPTGIQHPRVIAPDGRVLLESHPDTTLMMVHENRILFECRVSDNFKFEYDRKVSVDVLFDIGKLNLKSVIPTLTQMTQLVEQFIATFEGHINNPRPSISLGYDS